MQFTNFFSNRIKNPLGKTASWNDWVNEFLTKEAGEAKPECDDDPRGQCRGQVINNDNEEGAHSYQEGESVDGKKDQAEGGGHKPNKKASQTKAAHCAKDMGECSKAGDVTEEHGDAESAEVGKAQVKQKINNDPNYQKGESTNPGKVDGKNKKDSNSKGSKKEDKKEASAKAGFKKLSSLNRKEKMQFFASMSGKKGALGGPAYPIQYCEAMAGLTFANMKDNEKTWFKKFWKTLFPDSYVEEMAKDR